jgi:hypothetical protein
MTNTNHFDDVVIIECLDNGKKVEGEVMSFKEGNFLTVSIQRSFKLNMQYDSRKSLYIGTQAGLEFVTEGPKNFVSKDTR